MADIGEYVGRAADLYAHSIEEMWEIMEYQRTYYPTKRDKAHKKMKALERARMTGRI